MPTRQPRAYKRIEGNMAAVHRRQRRRQEQGRLRVAHGRQPKRHLPRNLRGAPQSAVSELMGTAINRRCAWSSEPCFVIVEVERERVCASSVHRARVAHDVAAVVRPRPSATESTHAATVRCAMLGVASRRGAWPPRLARRWHEVVGGIQTWRPWRAAKARRNHVVMHRAGIRSNANTGLSPGCSTGESRAKGKGVGFRCCSDATAAGVADWRGRLRNHANGVPKRRESVV